jgi:4-aminobutyrate aminotransferase
MIARKRIMDWPHGSHGNTYGGNPLACAAALATIDLVEKEYMDNAAQTGAYARDCLEEIASRHPSIAQVRGIGLMLGVEFSSGSGWRHPDEPLRNRVVDLSFERGLLLLGCGKSTIRLSPPLCITRAEIDEGLLIFEEAISIAEKE